MADWASGLTGSTPAPPKPGTYKQPDGSVLVVYPDGTRAVVDKNGDRRVFDASGRLIDASSAKQGPKPRDTGQTASGKTKTETAKDDAAAQAAAKQAAAGANTDYVWLDGHRVKVTAIGVDQFGNKQYTFATDADGYQKAQNYTLPTAYSALDNAGSTPGASTQFLMSNGIQLGADGNPIIGAADATNGLITQGHTGRNMMTIGNALQWLANLSVKDPSSYTEMVDKLHSSGYLSDSAYMQAGGGYSQGVADAFARAAADTAVLNSTDPKGNGYNMTLDQLLDQKASASADMARKARAAAYQPVARTFTDPEQVKAAAKSAAQAAIGRDLTPAEEAKLTSHFRSLETQKFNAIDAAGRSGDNATITDPSVGGQVQAFLDQNPQEQANYRAAQYGSALRGLFGLKG